MTASTEPAFDLTHQVTESDTEAAAHGEESSQSLPHVDACSCACCSNFNAAHHPTDFELSKKPHGQKNWKRSIQASWYKKHPWISVCTSSYKVFCYVCCSARSQDLINFTKRYKLAFVEGGFCKWKKALQRFSEHEKSEMHREAMTKVAAKSNAVDVGAQLNTQRSADQRDHRSMFLKLLECVRYLARQGLAFRGNHEDSVAFEGNLYQLLLLKAKDCVLLGS